MLWGMLARILALVARWRRRRRWQWRAVVPAIVPVISSAVMITVIVPAVRMAVAVMVGRAAILHGRLPHDRGLPIGLAGPWHGTVWVAAPVVAIGVNLRGHKKCAVILLVWRAGRHNRSNNIASLWITILGCYAPVVKIFAL